MRFLSVILKYNGKMNELYKTLDSIEHIRLSKEIKSIILSNDNKIKENLSSKYRFEVDYIYIKDKMGVLYKNAIEKCDTPYITFAVAGDTFFDESMRNIVDILKKEEPNVMKTRYLEKYLDLNGIERVGLLDTNLVEKLESCFYKVKYLFDNDMAFDNEFDIYAEKTFFRKVFLRTNCASFDADSYLSDFNVIRIKDNQLSKNIEYIDELYLSLQNTLNYLIDNNSQLVNYFIVRTILTIYILVCSEEFASKETLKDKKEEYEEIVYSLYKKYTDEYESFPIDKMEMVFKTEFERLRRDNINIKVVEQFASFITRMKAKYESREKSNHLLDIIVPEYNGGKYIYNLLNSISKQKNIDFSEIGIIIVDDCSPEELNLYKFKKYPLLNITFIKNEKNDGPGVSRQHGLDISTADYVTFMDCDDEFYDTKSFAKMVNVLKEHNITVAKGCFAEELKSGKVIINNPDKLYNFLHGMYYNRQYLVDNDIRFHEKLRISEDSYFNNLVLMDAVVYPLKEVVYYWRYRENSLVRSKNLEEFFLTNLPNTIICGRDSAKYALKHNKSKARAFALSCIMSAYCILCSYVVDDLDEKELEIYEKLTYEAYLELKDCIAECTKEEYDESYQKRKEALKRSLPGIATNKSYDEFINYLEKKY